MSWIDRISVKELQQKSTQSAPAKMTPGLTGEYDRELREKAGLHIPPPPPECMGVEGEYDPSGLAKRVAIALDQDPMIEDIGTLEIVQTGRTIAFKGHLADQVILDRIVELASKVDGTDRVDVEQVEVKEGGG
ncbi:MAG: BON domain-containing protein [Leptolyngbyaceae cyanobacterium SL_7_1]|nr:BON domain-containing protein [Leptolyngbyaceae cyanobacterium SL_7_1]